MKLKKQAATANVTKSAIAVAVATALTAPAMAQDVAIDEIMVTATKRAQNIQDVPIAVTSVSGDDLIKKQVVDILSLEKAIPGLTIETWGNNPKAIMRGAGSTGTSDIAVPIYRDGMYLPASGQALAGFIDVERVEALRGPQGTLFGRNTFGGLINLISKKPDLEGTDFGVSASVGDYSLQKLEGFVNIPMGDKAAFRLTAADEQRDPFVENVVNPRAGLKDSDYTYARAQLRFEPTETLSINLTGSYWKDTGNGNLNWAYKSAGIPLDRNDPTRINAIDGFLDPRMGIYEGCVDGDRPGGRSIAGNICDGDDAADIIAGTHTIDLSTEPLRELEETAFQLKVDWELSNHNLTLNAALFDYEMIQISDADYSLNETWYDGTYDNSKSQQIDLTLSSTTDSAFQYTVGAYLFDDQDNDNTNAYIFASLEESWSGYAGATPDTPSWAYWNSEGRGGTKSTAIYGQADYSFTDKLRMTAGLRYTKDDRKSQGSSSLAFDPTTRLGPELPTFDYTGRPVNNGDDSNTDYRIGFAYNPSGDVMLYGSVATAYIAGSTDVLTQTLLEPQTNDTIEFGVKSTLLDGELTFNASIYDAQYDGLLTTTFVTQPGSGVISAVSAPGGSVDSQGVELEGFWYPNDQLTIDFGITFENSEHDKFNVGAGALVWTDGTPPIGADIGPDGTPIFIMDGKQTPYSPDTTVGLGIAYEFDLGSKGIITPYLNTYYNSGYMTNRAPVFFGEQDAYTEIDFSVGWRSADGNYTASLWVNNATDELIQTYTEILSRARVAYDYQAPRTWGARFGYNF